MERYGALSIDYTTITAVDSKRSNPKFLIIQPYWDKFPKIKRKAEID
jgi:hypothetical protein